MSLAMEVGRGSPLARPPRTQAARLPAHRRALRYARRALLAAALLVLWVPVLLLALGMQTLVVTGGSMEPAASAGDVIVLERVATSAVRVGDVITFKPLREGGLRTHRVVSIHLVEGEGVHFRTKGDANEGFDPNLVPADNVLGRVVTIVPAAGRIYLGVNSRAGRAILVGVPALVLIVDELRRLGGRAPRPLDKRRPVRRMLRVRAGTIAVFAAAAMALAAPAVARFTDTASAASNSFSTGQVNAPTITSAAAGLLPCRVTLVWTAPATGLAPDGYDVLRSTTSGGPYSLVTHVSTVTTVSDTTVVSNTTYYYVLRSTLRAWTSAGSGESSATTAIVCI